MTAAEELKKNAARAACEAVRSGMVLGLGTGSTTHHALVRLGELLREGRLKDIVGIPSSLATEKTARGLGIPLGDLEAHPEIDLTIDGADEVDPELNLIKGGGGALLREKVIAQASRRNLIVVDESKLSPRLGTRWALPVEVVPFACAAEKRFLASLGAAVRLRVRDGRPVATDQGHWILDAAFGPIADPAALAGALDRRAGIVEHGLFLDLAHEVIVATADGVRRLSRPS